MKHVLHQQDYCYCIQSRYKAYCRNREKGNCLFSSLIYSFVEDLYILYQNDSILVSLCNGIIEKNIHSLTVCCFGYTNMTSSLVKKISSMHQAVMFLEFYSIASYSYLHVRGKQIRALYMYICKVTLYFSNSVSSHFWPYQQCIILVAECFSCKVGYASERAPFFLDGFQLR